ncbi:MAG TPA: ATP-dependent endonuclease [Pirellulaceae bacterium]|nr:ATP-dependent endonuclease [Pirellulaceae bacterium]
MQLPGALFHAPRATLVYSRRRHVIDLFHRIDTHSEHALNPVSNAKPIALSNAPSKEARSKVRVIVVVEGQHDIEFLRRLSQLLSAEGSDLPNLAAMETCGELVFLPTGGGDLASWAQRLAPLGCAEFHLYDREQSPETELRREVVAKVLKRPRCYATLTSKRTLENYLHPVAIQQATGIQLAFTDHDDVAALFAQRRFQQSHAQLPWEQLPPRARKRLANQAKRVLNVQAVECMSRPLLELTDTLGEVRSWFQAIQRVAEASG